MNGTTFFTILFALLIRWMAKGIAPMFGDYEAQRHWMEITVNIPVKDWYTNSTENDLNYWGLDYPPLTAYHSWLMGKIANYFNPEWVKLNESRGFESYEHKIFMRSTVFISDLVILIPALYYYELKLFDQNFQFNYFLHHLFVPSLILIDHGHFQYNCISLGLFLWAVICLIKRQDILASILFCLSFNYKQMALYYSLPIFFLLLRRCFNQRSFAKLTAISFSVIATMMILWSPYLSDLNTANQVFRRIFPLNRGIYEDKVANFWYCLSVFIKIKNYFEEYQLAWISAFLTILASLPSCYLLFRQNTMKQLKYSLFNVSMAFFLFSFQVHEKSILFVNVAILLLTYRSKFMVIWFSLISTFSLLPLLIKDNLVIPYFALTIIYVVINYESMNLNSKSSMQQLFKVSIMGAILLSLASLVIAAPEKYPHIHTLLNCMYSFGHFILFYLYFLGQQCIDFQRTDEKYPNVQNRMNLFTVVHRRPKMKRN
ncbi:Glucosyltransferase-like protein [Dermatophagoides pteronyssinus]|uniref:Alpha-1,3-glucosyltransferase n=1 Tax=Dermatophagoides pteronyssinus TaxID=6956 RepID=A0ABQ8J869_DERPT|nr:Glucosyltransferase-like protein [Dermatophagoides pteronyssinus]